MKEGGEGKGRVSVKMNGMERRVERESRVREIV
jgi:hypothetical protein